MGISQKTKEDVADAFATGLIEQARQYNWSTGKMATHIKLWIEEGSSDNFRYHVCIDWTDDPQGEGWIQISD